MLSNFNFQYKNRIAQDVRILKMSDFLRFGQDLIKLWHFQKKVIEIPKFDDFTGLSKPFINQSNLNEFEKVMWESCSSGKMLSKTHWLFEMW